MNHSNFFLEVLTLGEIDNDFIIMSAEISEESSTDEGDFSYDSFTGIFNFNIDVFASEASYWSTEDTFLAVITDDEVFWVFILVANRNLIEGKLFHSSADAEASLFGSSTIALSSFVSSSYSWLNF